MKSFSTAAVSALLFGAAFGSPLGRSAQECSNSVVTVTVTAGQAAATPAAAGGSSTGGSSNNIQKFTGSLGGPPPPVVSSAAERPFSVNGDTFLNAGAALTRSCDVQHNACANAANSGKLAGGVGQCDKQNDACKAANSGNGNNAGNNNGGSKAGNGDGGKKAPGSDNGKAGDFGSCSNPSIKFADGLDGRNQAAFAPNNAADFNHGSALNIKVIADFICGQLKDKCKASGAAVSKCADASTAAEKQTGQASADAFNRILGA